MFKAALLPDAQYPQLMLSLNSGKNIESTLGNCFNKGNYQAAMHKKQTISGLYLILFGIGNP